MFCYPFRVEASNYRLGYQSQILGSIQGSHFSLGFSLKLWFKVLILVTIRVLVPYANNG